MSSEPKIPLDVKAALVAAAVLVVVASMVGDVSLSVVSAIVVLCLLVFAMMRSPIRQSMMVIMFFVFVLPNPAEGLPSKWIPPFYKVGAIVFNHLNTVDRSISAFSSLSVSGLDIFFAVLVMIIAVRRNSGSRVDSAGQLRGPQPLTTLALVAIGTALFVWVSGLLRGGDVGMSLWQLANVMYVPIVFLLFNAGLRGPADHRALAKTLLWAAIYKCLMAVYVIATVVNAVDPETGSTRPPFGTSHNDSMLFSAAFVLVLASLVENWGRRSIRLALLVLPILVAGTIANNRRLAWVQVALVFITVYFVSRESPLKRKLRRRLFLLAAPFALYLMAGWDSQYGKLFKMARMVRSVVDAKSDGSSQWRELENVNLIATFRHNVVFGTGFGHPYEEVVQLPAVPYPLERYSPHNSLLGIWAYCGCVGYAGVTMLWVCGVYFAMRAYYTSSNPEHRVAALVSFGAVLVYLLQCFGDIGIASWTGVFLMGSGLAVAGKLATATGQWNPTPRSIPHPARSPRKPA